MGVGVLNNWSEELPVIEALSNNLFFFFFILEEVDPVNIGGAGNVIELA